MIASKSWDTCAEGSSRCPQAPHLASSCLHHRVGSMMNGWAHREQAAQKQKNAWFFWKMKIKGLASIGCPTGASHHTYFVIVIFVHVEL